jgi:hypothetical protein
VKPIVNIADATYTDLAALSRMMGSELPAGRFGGRMAPLAPVLQTKKLGVNVTDPLKILAVSTMLQPEVCHYPDSKKVAVLDGMGPQGFRQVGRQENNVDYWEGE